MRDSSERISGEQTKTNSHGASKSLQNVLEKPGPIKSELYEKPSIQLLWIRGKLTSLGEKPSDVWDLEYSAHETTPKTPESSTWETDERKPLYKLPRRGWMTRKKPYAVVVRPISCFSELKKMFDGVLNNERISYLENDCVLTKLLSKRFS